MDLQTICMTVEEIRSPLNHITSEVFRRGFHWEPKVENPDRGQIEVFFALLSHKVRHNLRDQYQMTQNYNLHIQ